MSAAHVLIAGIIFLLVIGLVAFIQKGVTGKRKWSLMVSLILFLVITPLVAGVNWSALFH